MNSSIFDDIDKIAKELNKKEPTKKIKKINELVEIAKNPEGTDRYIDTENKLNKVQHESEINAQNKQAINDYTVGDTSELTDIECFAFDDSQLDEIIKMASTESISMEYVMNYIDKIAEEFGEETADILSDTIMSINKI